MESVLITRLDPFFTKLKETEDRGGRLLSSLVNSVQQIAAVEKSLEGGGRFFFGRNQKNAEDFLILRTVLHRLLSYVEEVFKELLLVLEERRHVSESVSGVCSFLEDRAPQSVNVDEDSHLRWEMAVEFSRRIAYSFATEMALERKIIDSIRFDEPERVDIALTLWKRQPYVDDTLRAWECAYAILTYLLEREMHDTFGVQKT